MNLPEHITHPPDIIVVPCGAEKDPTPALVAAVHRYTGAQFRLGVEAALALAVRLGHMPSVAHSIYILSAKFGLLEPNELIPPYDVKMGAGSPEQVTPEYVAQQLDERAPTRIHALTPNGYTDLLRDAVAAQENPAGGVVTYFEGCRGIGDQRKVLASIKRGKAAVPPAS